MRRFWPYLITHEQARVGKPNMPYRKCKNVRRLILALLSHILSATFFKVICSLSAATCSSACPMLYFSRIKPLAQAIKIIRESPEDEQDTIARQLIQLIDLAQSTNI